MVRLPFNANAFCLTITRLALQFIQVYQIHIAGAAEMPDAMEIIFQKALTFGKSGAVSILLFLYPVILNLLSLCPDSR